MSLTAKVIAFAGVLMLLGVLLVAGALTTYYVRAMSDVSLERLEHLQQQVANTLQNTVTNARRDVSFLTASPSVLDFQNARGVDKHHVEEVFKSLIQNTAVYAQIRFIGVAGNGRELVRVERSNGEIRYVGDGDLQVKGDHDYFRQAIALAPGESYVSGIDLNREYGEIAVPHSPMLRVAMPVYPVSDASSPVGIAVINISVNEVFAGAAALLPDGYKL